MADALKSAFTPLIGNIRALAGTFGLQRRLMFGTPALGFGSLNSFSLAFQTVPTVAVVAWIASQTNDPIAISYLALGGPLLTVWNITVFRTGWSLLGEIFEGTLDLALVSRTPLILVTLGKVGALATFSTLVGGTASILAYLAITGWVLEAEKLPLLAAAFIVATISLTALAFVFAPVGVLMAGRPGFMNAIIPAGVVLSGFLYPIGVFPLAVQVIARLVPPAWAMDGTMAVLEGAPIGEIATDFLIALLLSIIYVGLVYVSFVRVERRVRKTGALGTF
ncbi:MAG: ABC transporter permease [Dehalococcoidia bacterium]|nr:ABC transporter permease [Dehalococcoidia bacterium]